MIDSDGRLVGFISPAAGKRVLYKTIDIIGGKPVPRYTTERPSTGEYEVVNR